MPASTRFLASLAILSMVSAQATTPTPTLSPAAQASASAAAAAAAAAAQKQNAINEDFRNYLLLVCGSVAIALIIWRVGIELVKRMRTLTSLNNDTQRYFAIPSSTYASFKKHLLYAPIFRKRHNREFKLSAAVNVGTLPTRFQSLFLSAYLGTNIAFAVLSIDWDADFATVARTFRNRTGVLATINMIPLFLMATRNNPLINWLNMSFDTFNLLHRWFGRIVVLEALAHVLAFVTSTVKARGWSAVWSAIQNVPYLMYGFIAIIAFVTIAIQANSILRHAFYETFKYLHISLAILALVGLYFHLKLEDLPQTKLVWTAVGIWVSERILRIVKTFWRNGSGAQALVEALPGNACRVTVDMPRPWAFKPGHHAYLYMPSVGLWTSHPFSVAWSEEAEKLDNEKLAMNRQEVLAMQKTSMSFIIRGRTGFTDKLLKKAQNAPDGRLTLKCFAEGPYGGMHMMHSYGTVMMFAGGVGITHQVPHVRDLVAGYANGTVAARKIVLVWIIQSPEHLEWIRPWMTSILAMEKRRDVLRIMLFVSRPRSTKEIHSPSATVQMFPGRPNIETLMDIEMENQVGALGVSVCGSGSLSDDVRLAVRNRQHAGNIDFIEEAFSW